MAIHANRRRVAVPIAAIAAGVLVASALGVTTRVNAAPDPGKASAGAFGTVDVDPPNLPANTCSTPGAPAPGVKVGDHVVVGAPYDLDGGLVGTAIHPVIADILYFRICNVTAAAVDGGNRTWTYMVVR